MKKKSVIIVDDEDQIIKNLKFILESQDYFVIPARSADEAYEKFLLNQNAVIVTDVKMPRKSGIELLEKIKKDFPSTQIIILSGNYEKEDSISAVKFKAFDFIKKPLKSAELIQSIDKAFQESSIVQREIDAALAKQREMMSFLSHTIGNTIATTPESLKRLSRKIVQINPAPDADSNKLINQVRREIETVRSCFISIDKMLKISQLMAKEPELAQEQWLKDAEHIADVPIDFIIAMSLKQVLSRILFEYQHISHRKQYFKQENLENVRINFIDNIITGGFSESDYKYMFDWIIAYCPFINIKALQTVIKVNIHGIRFSILLACIYEVLYNALKYSNNINSIEVGLLSSSKGFEFTCINTFDENSTASSGTSKGLSFIHGLVSQFNQIHFKSTSQNDQFIARLKYTE